MSVGEREGRRNRGFTESKKKTQINKEVENKAMTKVYGVGRSEVLEGLQKVRSEEPNSVGRLCGQLLLLWVYSDTNPRAPNHPNIPYTIHLFALPPFQLL